MRRCHTHAVTSGPWGDPQTPVPDPWRTQPAATTALPSGPAGGGPPPSWPPQPSPGHEAGEARSRAGVALGVAIGAGVLALLTLVVSVVALGVSVSGSGEDWTYDDYGYEPMRGRIAGHPDGGTLGGDRMAYAVEQLQADWGYEADIECPDSSGVSVSSVVVCRGVVDEWDWTGAVFFEDTEGGFVVAEF